MSRITSRCRGVVVCLHRSLGPGVLLVLVATADPVLADERAEAIGRRLEQAAEEGDAEAFLKLFDVEAMADRAARSIKKDENREVARATHLDEIRRAARSVVRFVSEGGHYDFLRVRDREGRTFLLFRLIGPDPSLDYHEYLLSDGEQGPRRIEDLYRYSTGDFYAESVDRGYRLYEQRASDPDRQKEASLMVRFTEATHAGNSEAIVRAYNALPERLRREKRFATQYRRAASRLGGLDHRTAVNVFRDYFSGDVASELVGFLFFLSEEQYGEARRCVDALARTVGNDPYLDAVRANLYLHAGDSERALERAKEAIRAEKDLLPAYYVLLDVVLATADHTRTVKVLDEIERRFPVVFENLEAQEEYARFIESDEYREWLRKRTEK